MAQIIPFPLHRATTPPIGSLPDDASEYAEAIFHMRTLRADCAANAPTTRKHQVALIMLNLWEKRLAQVVAAPHVTNGGR